VSFPQAGESGNSSSDGDDDNIRRQLDVQPTADSVGGSGGHMLNYGMGSRGGSMSMEGADSSSHDGSPSAPEFDVARQVCAQLGISPDSLTSGQLQVLLSLTFFY
jgi:hypothetical protein